MGIAYREVLKSMNGSSFPIGTVTPPNRLETRNWELISSLLAFGSKDTLETLRGTLRTLTGRQHIFFAPSCRSAIAQVLSILPQQEVVMPAFTCPVVRTAVELAGKRIIYVDVARRSVNATCAEFEREAKPGRVLLPTHLFGISTDVERICELAADRGCVTIEDAAGAFAAKRNGRILGTFGDVGIFSFERSKRVPAFRGAAIVINNEQVIDPAKLAANSLLPRVHEMPARDLVFALLYNLATIPWLYGRLTVPELLRRYATRSTMPDEETLETAAAGPFYTQDFHPLQASLVLRILKRFDRIREHITNLVNLYEIAFRNSAIQHFITSGTDVGAMLRFPIAFSGRRRADVLRESLRHGVYLETNYERPLPDKANWSKYPNAVWAAETLTLLPLYSLLSLAEAERLAAKLLAMDREMPFPRLNTEVPEHVYQMEQTTDSARSLQAQNVFK